MSSILGPDGLPLAPATDPVPKAVNPLADDEAHALVLDHLKSLIFMSERKMSQFYARWTANEQRVQAYIQLKDYEALLKEQNDLKGQPQAVSIVLPHSYATIATMVTYWLHTFAGQSPMFTVRSNQGERAANAQNMEILLQYNADHVRFIKWLYQFLQDGAIYGVGIIRTGYETKYRMRTVMKAAPAGVGTFDRLAGMQPFRARERRIVYQGALAESVDPYMFFPDPRVPMSEVNRKGEFVFWRSFVGYHTLKTGEADGLYFDIDRIPNTLPTRDTQANISSARAVISGGDPHAGAEVVDFESSGRRATPQYYQIDEGTVEVVPSKLGLSALAEAAGFDPDYPCKFLFTIANLKQIIRVEVFDHDHAMHPVAVTEPGTMGYGFGQPGSADMIGPLQDMMGWLFNSHMENVRSAINNQFVVDPSMVEMQDLKRQPKGGRIIRLKNTAYGMDVRQAISQLPVTDVTGQHLSDMGIVQRIADSLSGVNDNTRGIQDSGGRKTATEVRTTSDAGASRLAAHARLISAQAITDVTEMMCLDNQQYLEREFEINVLGSAALEAPVSITPETITGDFYYPVNDGTLPFDKVAMFDLWNQLFQIILSPPGMQVGLPMRYDVGSIFEWIAKLGGARNIAQFKVQMMPDAQAAAAAQAGNMVPAGMGMPPGPGGGQPTGMPMNVPPQPPISSSGMIGQTTDPSAGMGPQMVNGAG